MININVNLWKLACSDLICATLSLNDMQHPPFIEIANTFGAPVYVYDAQVITAQYDRLKRAFQQVPNLRFHYAVKANSNLSVLKLMHSLGAGLDTVSIEEVRLGLLAGVAPEDIIYTRWRLRHSLTVTQVPGVK